MRYFIIESETTYSEETNDYYKYTDFICVKEQDCRPRFLKDRVLEQITGWCEEIFENFENQFKRAEWEDQEDYTEEKAFGRFVQDTMDNTDYFEATAQEITQFIKDNGLE